MKHQAIKSLGLVALVATMTNLCSADAILFQDNFESGTLDKWAGKAGVPHQGVIVADPLNPANHVLTFSGVAFGGDIFSATPIDVSRDRHYVLCFDFLGQPSGVENGGFIGLNSGFQEFWIGGTYAPALNTPASVATTLTVDGRWHHYEIDFTDVVAANGLTRALVMLEDWFNLGSIPGDALFDNIRVVGLFDITTVLAQVPCDGPAPGKKWKNHGQYVSTVSKVVEMYLSANIITESEGDQIMSLAGRSDCGKK